MNTEQNPSAFPSAFPIASRDDIPGMTLRDYFAAKAMQGQIANAYIAEVLGKIKETLSHADASILDTEIMPKVVSVSSYAIADAMLEARKGT